MSGSAGSLTTAFTQILELSGIPGILASVGKAGKRIRLRFDSPDGRLAREEAVCEVLAALQKTIPGALVELRDLPHDAMEDVGVIESAVFDAVNSRVDRPLKLIKLADLPGDIPLEPELGGPPAVFVSDDVGVFARPIQVITIPRAVSDWASRWRLASDALESTCVLLRRQWARRPEAADTCELLFSSLPSMVGIGAKFLSAASWRQRGVENVQPEPMLNTKEEFLRRAALEYDKKQAHYAGATLAGKNSSLVSARNPRSLTKHAEWFVRIQVREDLPNVVARAERQTLPAVHTAVKNLSRLIGVKLRRFPRTGRPKGARDVHPGDRPSRRKY